MQLWNEHDPCSRCGATSNTSHSPNCINAGLFDSEGNSIAAVPTFTSIDPVDYQLHAKLMLSRHLNRQATGPADWVDTDEIFVVWFAKTLGNWKALLSTTRSDGMYYELTHSGAKNETYIDDYIKVRNTVISDDSI